MKYVLLIRCLLAATVTFAEPLEPAAWVPLPAIGSSSETRLVQVFGFTMIPNQFNTLFDLGNVDLDSINITKTVSEAF